MTRKDQHIKYALDNQALANSFDDIELLHQSLPSYDLDNIDINTQICGYSLTSPFFINAMTGGTQQALEINRQLSIIAKECDLLLFTGSYSTALQADTLTKASFSIIKQTAPEIMLGTNIGLDKDYLAAQSAIDALDAKILQVHLNTVQELIMLEGDRNFQHYQHNLQELLEQIKIPIIVKETGSGMTASSIKQLIQLGVKTIDISGKGGTNFAYIENQRRSDKIAYLNSWGQTTVCSLLEAQPFMHQAEIIASGGVRNPLDIIKSLVLGVKAVGIAGTLLKSLQQHGLEETITQVKNWQTECRLIMSLLNCNKISDLTRVEYVLKDATLAYYQQRSAKLATY